MPSPLTVRSIDAFLKSAPSDKRSELSDKAVPGLRLVVFPSGHVSWQLQYKLGSDRRKFTLGAYGSGGVSLSEARDAARNAKQLVRQGICPKANADRSRAENAKSERLARQLAEDTLARVFSDYLDDKQRTKSLRSASALRMLFSNRIEPTLGNRPIREITRDDLRRLLRGIVDDEAPISANRVHSLLRPLFKWAIAEERIDANPFDGIPQPVNEVSRERVLSEDEIRWIWKACEAFGYPYGHAFRFLLLTLCRRDEGCKASFAEMDLAKGVWTIPAERSKNGLPTDVPLSAGAVELLKTSPRLGGEAGPVFSTGTVKNDETRPIGGYSKAKAALDAKVQEIARLEKPDIELERWTLHDLRRTGATYLAQMGAPIHIVELILNHRASSLGGVAKIYNRHSYFEERRHWLQAWSSRGLEIANGAPLGNVLQFRGEAAGE
ncbi:tyrosine-type recombinase/integrase [Roseibium aggregatum]|uniref:Putative prophage CPS-53 integrase n=1 Tax=Roseibium aggregatum TaxID=187304 RepID=A0A0M6Y093_9HYPH|nr:site-specific integrase [Roseibium aggregatum]CTQ42708.1 Putative prophage CPS-53 integrase [Roseibium aggregatum]